jgi:Ca2+-binding EF-hand superfamily protein
MFDVGAGYRVQGHEESDDKCSVLREVVQRCAASLGMERVCRILQVCKIFQVFAKMDTDNDGRIKLHDFTQVIM